MIAWLIGVLLGIEGLRRDSPTTDDHLGSWSGGSPTTWGSLDGTRQLPPT